MRVYDFIMRLFLRYLDRIMRSCLSYWKYMIPETMMNRRYFSSRDCEYLSDRIDRSGYITIERNKISD
jgi:hypothetical protein